jgi:hypothetical protein
MGLRDTRNSPVRCILWPGAPYQKTGERTMPRKSKKNGPRKTPAQIIESLTRENVAGWMNERKELGEKVNAVGMAIEAMIAAKMDESHIESVRKTVAAGAFERLSYLENNVKRVALTLTRMSGYKHWESLVSANLEMIPTATEKEHKARLAETFGTQVAKDLPY